MTEKFESDFSEGESPGGFTYLDERTAMRVLEEREWDLRVKMFALDMAVQALPSLTSMTDSEDMKFRTVTRAANHFEKILRGEPVA
jgi:hypothetical protein